MTIDYTKLKVADIRQMLIDEERFTAEELDKMDIKGKSNWVLLHQNHELEDAQEEDELVWDDVADLMDGIKPKINQRKIDPDVPRYTDAEWNDYVMSLFSDEETITNGKNTYPTLNGMRRVAELLLGEIVFSGPVDIKTTMSETNGKAVVTYQIIIEWKLGAFFEGSVSINDGYPQKIFQAVASSWEDNTPPKFAVFPETIAENRAEARALRRALRLTTVSYEELPGQDTEALVQQRKDSKPTTGDWSENEKISDAQINTIDTMCTRLGIDTKKFINSGSKQYESIDEVSRSAAAGMIKQLNRYQSSGEDAVDIPLNLIGE
jgi:hypothetical protein